MGGNGEATDDPPPSADGQLAGVAGAAIIATDLAGRITYWNRAAEQFFGWSAAEAVGRNVLDLNVAPADATQANAIMERVRAGEQWSGEFHVPRRDGSFVPALVTNAPFLDDQGQLAGIIGVSVDIAELQDTRVKANQRASQQAAVAALGRFALAGTDLDRILHEAMRSVRIELGVPLVAVFELEPASGDLVLRSGVGWRDGLIGHRCVASDPPSHAHAALRCGRAVRSDDLTSETDLRRSEPLAQHGVVSGLSSPLTGPTGDVGVLSVHTTSRRAFAVEEARFLDSVAGILGAAFARSHVEEELKATVRRLQRSEEIRLAFLRATSHELRTPLAAIVGLAETLERHDGVLEDEVRSSLLERLTVNAGRLTALIDDLLDVDRLSAGLITAHRVPHDLEVLVRRVVEEHGSSQHRVELDLEPVTAQVDPPKLERVVVNLVANAGRHTPAGSTIRVRLWRRDAEVVLTVEDDGAGIDPGYLDEIFEPFVQGPVDHEPAQPGTGLGLTLTRELVHLHGGTLRVANRPEGGARFEVVLPLSPGDDGA